MASDHGDGDTSTGGIMRGVNSIQLRPNGRRRRQRKVRDLNGIQVGFRLKSGGGEWQLK